MTTGTATPLQMEAPSHTPAQTRDGSALGAPPCSASPIDRVIKWRTENPEEFERVKRAGLKASAKAVAAARRIQKKYQYQNWLKQKHLAKYQSTPEHIRAIEWAIEDEHGNRFEFRNLVVFIKGNPDLFDPADIIWKRNAAGGERCRAYNGLASLRPTASRLKESWKGWSWSWPNIGIDKTDTTGKDANP